MPTDAQAGRQADATSLSSLILLRGGGDLGTGVAWRLTRAGFPVAVLELEHPLTIRRTVALSSAVDDGEVDVEGMIGRRVGSTDELLRVAATGVVPVLVAPALPPIARAVVVDARLAKRNLDTRIDDADLVVALGPGFTAGLDCHAVVETMRGHHLGRVFWTGAAAPDSGVPGDIGGRSAERVLRAPVDGEVRWDKAIADVVQAGDELGRVDGRPLVAPFTGVVRGLIRPGTLVREGQKIGDVDPRAVPAACSEISDKALAVGGGVLEAVMTWWHRSR